MKFDTVEIRSLVHAHTRRTGTPVHDEDLEQDIALEALEAFRRLRCVTHPKALLGKIVRDAVRSYWRRRRPTEDLDGVDERFVSHRPAPEADIDRKRLIDLLRRGMKRLRPDHQRLLELFYEHNCSVADIARLQRRSVSAVKMNLVRSRQSLARIVRILATTKSPRPRFLS